MNATATDGVDGTSDAARLALEKNDSHAFFQERPERIATGPTGTNVADLAVALAD